MVKNLAEKVDGYPLNQGCYVLFVYNWEQKKRPLYGVAGCCYSGVSNVLKSIYGKMVRTFRIVCGCPLLRVSVKRGSTVDLMNCRFVKRTVCGCPLLRVSVKRGSTVDHMNCKFVKRTVCGCPLLRVSVKWGSTVDLMKCRFLKKLIVIIMEP